MLRTASLWVVAFVLAVIVIGFFAGLTVTQLTSSETSHRVLRRAVAVSTDIDALLPRIESELHASAGQTEGPTVRVPGFPIVIDLPREEAASLSGAALRERLLVESADRIYDDGMDAWAEADPDGEQSLERLSAAGSLRSGLDLMRSRTHTVALVLTVLLGLLALGMTVALLVVVPPPLRLLVLGGVILAAALPSLAAAVALRFAFRTAGTDGDPFVEGLLDIGSDAMWIPIRNYLTLTVLGFAVLGLGVLSLWWSSRLPGETGRLADYP